MSKISAAAARSRRVAVVGGGPGGLASGRFLLDAGHQPTIFEGGSEFGGIWAPEPTNRVVYRGLRTNIPKVCMQSFDLDFATEYPSYIDAAELGQYIIQYGDHFDLRRFTRFGAQVTDVQPLRSEAEEELGESAWRVRWVRRHDTSGGEATETQAGAEEAEEFDAVVVASGHYTVPYLPELPGQAEWMRCAPGPGARTVVHSREYDDPGQYASRVVLVVGGRSSAVDIARELRGVAAWVYVLEKGCTHALSAGTCTHVPLGAALGPDGHLRLGDETLPGPAIEDVVLATGYTYSFPFLDSEQLGLDYGELGRYVSPLYMHVAHARRPSLSFIGIPLAVPVPIPLFEAQARFVAARLRCDASTAAEREAWVAARRAQVGSRPQDLHFLGGDAWDYTRELMRMACLEGFDYEAYLRRLALVEAMYKDHHGRKPELPWGDDSYRRCQYRANWQLGTWQAIVAEDGEATASTL